MRCELCGKSIEEAFLGKLKGTLIKINEKGKNKIYAGCDECQKQFKSNIKEEIKKKVLPP